MINKTAQRKLKKIVGKDYAQDVLGILTKRKMCSRLGTPYSLEYIRMIFTGHRHNDDVEDAIYQHAKNCIELAAKRKQARESILNK